MNSYPRWKIALVAVVVLFGIFLALPTLFGEENALRHGVGHTSVLLPFGMALVRRRTRSVEP